MCKIRIESKLTCERPSAHGKLIMPKPTWRDVARALLHEMYMASLFAGAVTCFLLSVRLTFS